MRSLQVSVGASVSGVGVGALELGALRTHCHSCGNHSVASSPYLQFLGAEHSAVGSALLAHRCTLCQVLRSSTTLRHYSDKLDT